MHLKHIDKLLEAPDEHDPMRLRDLAAIEVMYATGCRASELGTITVDDFHNDLGIVKITGKGNRQRLVPIHDTAITAVRSYLDELRPKLAREDRHTGALFITRRGTAMDRFAVWAMIKKHARGCGAQGRAPAHAAPHVRHAPARRRRPTCASSRNCSDTPASPPRRSTRTWIRNGSSR